MSRKEVVRLILSFVILTSVELGTSYKGTFLTLNLNNASKKKTKIPKERALPSIQTVVWIHFFYDHQPKYSCSLSLYFYVYLR